MASSIAAMGLIQFVRRKSANVAEYFHPDYLASLARGDTREMRNLIRQRHRPDRPPDNLKQAAVRAHARAHGCRVLVETGTFRGDMLFAMLLEFDRLYSIELGHDLHVAALERFRGFPHVILLEGDSAIALPKILAELRQPALFWLDAHASGGVTARGDRETPIEGELAAIVAHPVGGHVILIDDAREFGKRPGYPTLDQVRAVVSGRYAHFEVKDDIIRIAP